MKLKRAYKLAVLITLIVGIAVAYYAYQYYRYIYAPNTKANCELFIESGSDLTAVVAQLKIADCLIDYDAFEWVAEQMGYGKNKIHPGRYLIDAGRTNRELIAKLRSGDQDAVNVVVPAARELNLVAKRVAQNIQPDSSEVMSYFFSEEMQQQFGLDPTGLKNRVIPNTYNMWWTSTPEELVSRLLREYDQFWKRDNRLEKAEKTGLSPEEVIVLASIVDRETNYVPEMPKIAGVYLNRLESSWALQADPTVVFALGNPNVKRVLTKDLEVDSPYNTYKYPGLPPGPISIPTIAAIDAVLNAESHDYFFFCAKPDNSGTHVFAKTLRAHLNNAREFHNWLNQQRIMR